MSGNISSAPSLLSGIFTQAAAQQALGLGSMATQAASSVAITGGAINGATIGATTPASGAFTTLSATGAINSAAGQFKFAGNVGFAIYGTPGANTTTAIGSNAGAAQSASTGGFNTFIGDSAGQNTQPGSGENTYVGNLAGVYSQTGHQSAYVGCGAGWFDTSSYNVALGSDCYRNVVSSLASGDNTAIGQNAMRNGSGYQNTALGNNAMAGTATTIALSGTQTAGDVVTLTFNAPASTLYGYSALVNVPVSVTVTSGMTTPQLASALVTAINATIPSLLKTGTQAAGGGTTNYVVMTFAGTATTGAQCVVTSSVSGAGTEIVTITPGYSGNNNLALGFNAMSGPNMQTASNNIAAGINSLSSLTTGSANIGIGQQAGQNIQASNGGVFIGSLAGALATSATGAVAIGSSALYSNLTASYDVAIGGGAMQYYVGQGSGAENVAIGGFALAGATGATFYASVAIGYDAGKLVSSANSLTIAGYNSGSKITTGSGNTLYGAGTGTQITTGSNNVVLGPAVASTTLTTGINNILIGTSSSIDTPASTTSNYLNIGGVITNIGLNTPTTTPTYFAGPVGISGSGPTWSSGTGVPTAVLAKGSMFTRTDGAAGSTLYITQGGGTWNAVAGV